VRDGRFAAEPGDDNPYPHGRLQSLDLNPNYLGALVAIPLVAATGLAFTTRRPVWLLAALPSLMALFATRLARCADRRGRVCRAVRA
jgi:hypothetical protein